MANNEISELVVSMKPEGLSQTTEGLQSVEEQTQQTAETMEEQSESADGFADKFQGAMQVAVSALAIGAAGLLSQVPVLGEAMSGVFALVESVAFQMDKVLRPVISPITNLLFNMANAIGGLEGPMGTLVGLLGTFVSAFGALAIVGKVTGLFSAFAGASSVLSTVLTTVAAGLTTLAGILSLPVAAVAALTAGVLALVAAFAVDFLGIRTKTVNALKTLWDWTKQLGSAFLDLAGFVVDGLVGAAEAMFGTGKQLIVAAARGIVSGVKGAWDFFTGLFLWASDKIGDLADGIQNGISMVTSAAASLATDFLDELPSVQDMKDFGANIIDGFVEGIKSKVDDVKNAFKSIAEKGSEFLQGNSPPPKGPLSNIDNPGVSEAFAGGLEGGLREVSLAASNVASQTESSLSNAQFATPRTGNTILEVDGQVLGEVTDSRQRGFTAVRNIDG